MQHHKCYIDHQVRGASSAHEEPHAINDRSEHQVADAVAASRRAGMSWKRIGVELGISAQGVQKRYGSASRSA